MRFKVGPIKGKKATDVGTCLGVSSLFRWLESRKDLSVIEVLYERTTEEFQLS
jgi:hypothetical protein